jgi:CheY-like chemotaxis protein
MSPTEPRPHILVVDDDLGSRTLTAIVLTEAGFSPVCVATAARALDRLGAEGADLVLTDLIMPGVSGIDLIRIVRTWADAPPVIAMTASDDPVLIAEALECGVASVLRKPVVVDALTLAIDLALTRRSAAA